MSLCPICGRTIGTYTGDPIFATPTLSTSQYQGFTILLAQHIKEIQDERHQQEIDNGVTPLTEFSPINIINLFQNIKQYILELRSSTEKILDAVGMSLHDFLSQDEDGNVITPKDNWTDPNLEEIKYQCKAIHIEDLRHLILSPTGVSWIEDWLVTPNTSFFNFSSSSSVEKTEDDLQAEFTGDKQGEFGWNAFGYYLQSTNPTYSNGIGSITSLINSNIINLEIEANLNSELFYNEFAEEWQWRCIGDFNIKNKILEVGILFNPDIYIKKYPDSVIYPTKLKLLSTNTFELIENTWYHFSYYKQVKTYASFRIYLRFIFSTGQKDIYFDFYDGAGTDDTEYLYTDLWGNDIYPSANRKLINTNLNNSIINLKTLLETYYPSDTINAINIQIMEIKFGCYGRINVILGDLPNDYYIKNNFNVNQIKFENIVS